MKPAPNLVLIGPMGAGKTSIGRRLAARLDLAFVDADHRLEQVTGATVPLIFEHEGEAGFRQRESQLIDELMRGSDQLVATGGGAVLSPDNRRRLRERGFVVYLSVGIEQQLQRLARDRTRPLLATGDRRAKLLALAERRDPLYADTADFVFDSDGLSVAVAVERIAQQLGTRWQREEAA
jgi:shikimate kinase